MWVGNYILKNLLEVSLHKNYYQFDTFGTLRVNLRWYVKDYPHTKGASLRILDAPGGVITNGYYQRMLMLVHT